MSIHVHGRAGGFVRVLGSVGYDERESDKDRTYLKLKVGIHLVVLVFVILSGHQRKWLGRGESGCRVEVRTSNTSLALLFWSSCIVVGVHKSVH